jgi:16S rRNA processing protein RimM
MADQAERAPDLHEASTAPPSLSPADALLAQAMGRPLAPKDPAAPGSAPRSRRVPQNALFLTVARVLRPHGIRGEIACEVITEFPQRFRRTKRVFLTPPPEPGAPPDAPVPPGAPPPREFAVEQARLTPGRGHPEVILRLAGLTDRDEAAKLRGSLVQVPESEAWKLPHGRYYWHQILGLRVVTTEGEEIGTVAEILETGANDVYVVKGAGGERLIPAVKQVVKRIAPERGEMLVELLPGM